MRNEWRDRDREMSRGQRGSHGRGGSQDHVDGGRSGHGSEFFGSEYNHSSSQDTGGMRGSELQSRNRDPSHDDDYMHWREQQMSRLDEDYHHWRGERRKKFAEEFDKWRSERSALVQGSDTKNQSADNKK